MAEWDDLALDDATLMGIAPGEFADMDQPSIIDSDKVTTNMTNAAKRYVKGRLTSALPSLVAKLSGPEVFLDKLIVHTDAELIQDVIGYAFLMRYYSDERLSDVGLTEVKRREAGVMFEDAFLAVKSSAQFNSDFIDAIEGSADEDLEDYRNPVYIA